LIAAVLGLFYPRTEKDAAEGIIEAAALVLAEAVALYG